MDCLTSHIEQERIIVYLDPEATIKRLQLDNQILQNTINNLESVIGGMRSRNRTLEQLCYALSDINRYYASQKLEHCASNTEAFIHFVENGGKEKFDQTHPWG